MDEDNDINSELERDPIGYSAMLACNELHYGRVSWLAEHIRLANFNISPIVAKKLLSLIESDQKNLFFELRLARRADLPPRHEDPQLLESRNFDMACEVAALNGFERGQLARACHEVAMRHGLKQGTVKRLITPYKRAALDSMLEAQAQQEYGNGNCDFLGRPKNNQTGFAEHEDDA